MVYGWAGQYIEVNLSEGTVEKLEADRTMLEGYLGGKGVNTRIMWERVGPEVDPLSPENLLIIGAGTLDGTVVPAANRTAISFKSPVTGFLGLSVLGGYFGPELKNAGYDTIVVSGKSTTPVYLWINDDTVELRDANHLWGKDTHETQAILRRELNPKAQILCIGPAGENGVYAATIEHSLGISASRRGSGTVMGDKRLKAIAVYGTQDINIARPNELYELCRQIDKRRDYLADHWKTFPALDPTYHLPMGAYGNFREDAPPAVYDVLANAQQLGESCKPLMIRRVGCYNCSLQCKQVQQAADGSYCGLKCSAHTRPMIATQIFDGKFNMEFYSLCEKYGMDSLSTENVVALVIDLYEKGILTTADTDGMHLAFRNAEVALTLVKKMAYREGLGDLMADGAYRATRRIGRGAEKYAVTTKKLEARHDFLFSPGDALAEAISDCADHHKYHSEVGMPPYFPWTEEKRHEYVNSEFWQHPRELEDHFLNRDDRTNYEGLCQWTNYIDECHGLRDSLGICAWVSEWLEYPLISGIGMFADLLSYATGMDIDEGGLRHIGQRIQSLVRSYNVREGLRRRDDRIPEFHFEMKPAKYLMDFYGPNYKTLDRETFNRLVDRFYEIKGWDRDGIPTKETLERLGLGYVYEELTNRQIAAASV
jgi:aldehyde:ferredoxin oxidoreductase